MGGQERPSFSLAEEPRPPGGPSLLGWALAVAGLAVALGALVTQRLQFLFAANLFGLWGLPLEDPWPLMAAPFLVGGALFALLPTGRGSPGATRAAGLMAVVGGAAALAVATRVDSYSVSSWWVLVPLSAGVPAAAIGSTDPAARLGPASLRSPTGWLRVGGTLGLSAVAGVAVGHFLVWNVLDPPTVLAPLAGTGVHLALALSGLLLVVAGALMVRAAAPAARGEPRRAPPPGPPRRMGLTAMLLYALVAESGLAAAIGASFAGLGYGVTVVEDVQAIMVAATAGGALGAVAYFSAAPRLDEALGRGRLLSVAYLTAALGPLLVLAFLGGGSVVALAAAAALFAFSLAASPQRYAIVFDLCPSRTRLRSSLDFHAVRLAAGAVGVAAVVVGYGLFEPLGLLLVSAWGVLGTAIFLPTLGSLGRRRP